MDLTLLHPKIVHIPIALGVLMPLLSAGIVLAWWREKLPRRAWVIAVIGQALLVVGGFAAMQTGEADEEIVERVVSEQLIHEHEEAADAFTYVAAGVLVLFIGALLVRKRESALGLAAAATIGTLVVFGLGYRTGEKGGELVYVHGAASAHIDGAKQAPPMGAPEQSDDDD